MSDPSDESITHVFDQTNGVIPAADGETDGALSGRTASGVADEVGAPGATDAVPPRGRTDDDARRAGTSDASDPASSSSAGGTAPGSVDVQSATIDDDRSDRDGEDFAPTADLPLPGSGRSDSSGGEEHVFAVDSAGDATETDEVTETDDVTGADDAAYSGAPAVAAWSAADDGRDEGRTRGESSTAPVDDASHTGRLADAYATGPAEQVDDGSRGASGSSTAAAYAAGPSAEASGSSTSDAAVSGSDAAPADERDSGAGADAHGPGATASTSAARSTDGLDDDSIGHVFDQTNGVIEAIDGESDGTAASDTSSAGDREAER